MLLLGRLTIFLGVVVFGYLWAFGGHQWAWWPWEASLLALVALNSTVWYRRRRDQAPTDGAVMRWWMRQPGPSKDPDDYR
jgi:hypothetical protein